MASIDRIKPEDYYAAFGTEQEQFEQWMLGMEEEWFQEGNRVLRETADKG